MRIPNISCKIEMSCIINPSEAPARAVLAISNIFPGSEIIQTDSSVTATSRSLVSLENVVESIRSKNQQRTYKRHLQRNMAENSSWLYLNKQAAFAGRTAICDDAAESPMGPIRMVISSSKIEEVIDWMSRDGGGD